MDKLRKLQLTELEILKELDRVCKQNKIQYSLGWGTMLGAVRHKGFIPWDDDLDVQMSYKDLKRLEKVWNSNQFFLQIPSRDIQSPYIFAKIRKNGTQMIDSLSQNIEIHQGIWIDIFPYVDSPKSQVGKRLQCFFERTLQSYRTRYINRKSNGVKSIIAKLLCLIPRSISLVIDSLFWKLIIFGGNSNSTDIHMLMNGTPESSFLPKDYLSELELYQFEDGLFYGSKDYDGYLSKIYGDYMTPVKYSHLESMDSIIL